MITCTDQHDQQIVFAFAAVAYLVRRDMHVVETGLTSGTALRFIGGGPEIWVRESIAEILEKAAPPPETPGPPALYPSRVRTEWPWSTAK